MNDSMLMLAASRQGDLTREAERDKMAARARAAARLARNRPAGRVLRLVLPPAGRTATGIPPAAHER